MVGDFIEDDDIAVRVVQFELLLAYQLGFHKVGYCSATGFYASEHHTIRSIKFKVISVFKMIMLIFSSADQEQGIYYFAVYFKRNRISSVEARGEGVKAYFYYLATIIFQGFFDFLQKCCSSYEIPKNETYDYHKESDKQRQVRISLLPVVGKNNNSATIAAITYNTYFIKPPKSNLFNYIIP